MVLTRGRRRIWAFEVKLGPYTSSEAREAVAKVTKIAEGAGPVSLSEKPPGYGDLSLGPRELYNMARELARRHGVV